MCIRAFPAAVVLLLLALGACDSLGPDDPYVPATENLVPLDSLVTAGPELRLNPNGPTPLAAELSLTTVAPCSVSVRILGPRPVSHAFEDLSTDHAYPVLGLYAGTENRVAIKVTDPTNGYALDTLIVSTEPLPAALPNVRIVEADVARMEEGMTLSGLSLADNGTWNTMPIMYDVHGDIRWYMDLSDVGGLSFPIKRFANGNLLIPHGNSVREMDMLGAEQNSWHFDGLWQHHEVVELPDGNLVVAVNVSGRETVEDHIIELDRTSGAIVREWDMRDVLDVARRTYMDDDVDWFHMNAIAYDADDDALVISGRNQGVAKVSGENELIWILAPQKGWGNAGVDASGFDTSEYLLTAVDGSGTPYAEDVQQGDSDASGFSWTWGQHAPVILPNGNLFIFDNGLRRNFSDASTTFSRGVEYEVDEDAMTVRQVWQYGTDRGSTFYSAIISDVDYAPGTGNRIVMPGIVDHPVSRALVTEVSYPGGDVVFEASVEFKNLNGTGQGWGQMDIVYRSQRMPLYPNQDAPAN